MVPTVKDIAHLPVDQLPPVVHVPPVTRAFDITVRPPGSKSLTNRALLLAALVEGTSELRGALVDADDARVMLRAVEQLGARVEVGRGDEADVVRVTGVGGRWRIAPGETVRLDLGNAGTATRFLTAAAVLAPAESGGVIIDGDPRMRERPIAELVEALEQLGVRVEYLGKAGFPPLRVVPPADLKNLARRVIFSDPRSSQFISAMMLVAPFFPRMLTIEMHGKIVSEPYVDMTWRLLQRVLGVSPVTTGGAGTHAMRMPVCAGRGFTLEIEPDASGATYFAGAAVISPKSRVLLSGLPSDPDASLQGDVGFLRLLRFMGALVDATSTGTTVRPPTVAIQALKGGDFSPTPDAAMTGAVLVCFASPTQDNPTATSELRGLRTLRVKETDRLEALRVELSKLGLMVKIVRQGDDEALRITPPPGGIDCSPTAPPVYFDTYDDHRMAMSLALVGLRRPNVYINNPACVRKTYPTFWRDLAKVYG